MPLMGLRGSNDWATYQRPENWRQGIFYDNPNGAITISGLTGLLGSEKTDDGIFHWWSKSLPGQKATGTAGAMFYLDVGLATAYTYAVQTTRGAASSTLYAKMTLAMAQEFKVGHQVAILDADQFDVRVNGKVIGINYNGTSSYIAIRLLEADTTAATPSATASIQSCDTVMIIGSVYPDGSTAPRGIQYDPTEYYNHCQTFRTAVEMTRRANKMNLRTGDQKKEAKREALQLHGMEIEKALIYGLRTSNLGDNGKPEYTFDGIYNFLKRNNSGNILSFKYATGTAYAGKTWKEAGEDWLDEQLQTYFTYTDGNPFVVCGAGAIGAINKLAKTYGNIALTPQSSAYGMKVLEWISPFGGLQFKTHPLLSRETSSVNTAIIFKPENIKWRVFDDTMYDPNLKVPGFDGTVEGWLTDIGPEFHHSAQFMVLHDLGVDNIV